MKTINSFEHLYSLVGNHQVTAQELFNGRTYLGIRGYSEIRLKESFREEILVLLSNMYGGHKKTREAIYRNLKRENRQCWGLERTVCCKRGGKYGMQYVAGQDYVSETRAIRRELS